MSDDITKLKRSRRLHKDEVKAKRQKNMLKDYGMDINPFESANYYAKQHALNCGNPKCAMCANPRKFWGELTLQEKRFNEISKEAAIDSNA